MEVQSPIVAACEPVLSDIVSPVPEPRFSDDFSEFVSPVPEPRFSDDFSEFVSPVPEPVLWDVVLPHGSGPLMPWLGYLQVSHDATGVELWRLERRLPAA